MTASILKLTEEVQVLDIQEHSNLLVFPLVYKNGNTIFKDSLYTN